MLGPERNVDLNIAKSEKQTDTLRNRINSGNPVKHDIYSGLRMVIELVGKGKVNGTINNLYKQ